MYTRFSAPYLTFNFQIYILLVSGTSHAIIYISILYVTVSDAIGLQEKIRMLQT